MGQIDGGEILVRMLVAEGVDCVFANERVVRLQVPLSARQVDSNWVDPCLHLADDLFRAMVGDVDQATVILQRLPFHKDDGTVANRGCLSQIRKMLQGQLRDDSGLLASNLEAWIFRQRAAIVNEEGPDSGVDTEPPIPTLIQPIHILLQQLKNLIRIPASACLINKPRASTPTHSGRPVNHAKKCRREPR